MSTDKHTPEQSDICANCGMEYHTHNLAPKAHKECNNGRGYFKSASDLLATITSQSAELSKLREENKNIIEEINRLSENNPCDHCGCSYHVHDRDTLLCPSYFNGIFFEWLDTKWANDSMTAKVLNVTKENDALREENERLKQQNGHSLGSLGRAEKKFKELEQSLTEKDAEIEKLKRALSELRETNRELSELSVYRFDNYNKMFNLATQLHNDLQAIANDKNTPRTISGKIYAALSKAKTIEATQNP